LQIEKPEPSYAILQKINPSETNEHNNIFIIGLNEDKIVKIVSIFKTT
jgi:hypothetical protein